MLFICKEQWGMMIMVELHNLCERSTCSFLRFLFLAFLPHLSLLLFDGFRQRFCPTAISRGDPQTIPKRNSIRSATPMPVLYPFGKGFCSFRSSCGWFSRSKKTQTRPDDARSGISGLFSTKVQCLSYVLFALIRFGSLGWSVVSRWWAKGKTSSA